MLRNEHKRETFVLISALREGAAHELRGSTSGMPPAALAAKLVRQLCDNLASDEAAAQWRIESWAVALGVQIPDCQSQISDLKSQISNPSAGVDLVPQRPAHHAFDLFHHPHKSDRQPTDIAAKGQKKQKADGVRGLRLFSPSTHSHGGRTGDVAVS